MDNIYDFPHYYDIAFSYRNVAQETDVLEQAIARFSKIAVRQVLELACGNSPHMIELANRGYEYFGLDLSPSMLKFAQEKAQAHNYQAHFLLGDLASFELEKPMDFVYIMLGSLQVKNTEELLTHFRSVEGALKPGGIYFLDWCVDFSPLDNVQDSWVTKQGKTTVTTHYSTRLHHAAKQLYHENILLDITEQGKKHRLEHRGLRRAIFPQEFLLASTKLNGFEFLGWWDNWDWNAPLDKNGFRQEISRPITILRKV